MALTTETDTNEESQTRQLRVNKKLSKVISSVPRSRFSKPRPNLPGSKRTESNVPVTPAKTSVKPEKNVPEKDVASTTIEKSDKIVFEKDDISIANEKSEQTISEKEEISSTNELSQFEDSKSCTDSSTGKSSDDIEVPENLNAQNLTLIEDDDNCITLNTESLQNLEEPPEINSPDKNKNQPFISSPDKSKNQPTINSPDKNKNQPAINSPDKNKNQPITNIVSSAVFSNTDRSSKYPHLTSILSKKRTEPRKEVQHKRHKKFKKGDVIPERSKMTMADLIYWNPVNPDPPSKNMSPEEDIQTFSNYEEPEECVDNPVEESNVGDSSAEFSVPKLVIAEDGSINIDQSSLVISRNIPEPTVTEVVRKDDTTYSSFRKRPMTKQWTTKDTTIFYKALSLVGTDFGLMEKIFPHRSRRELKLKFKREEKFNIDLINRAMYESHLTFDGTTLEDLIEQLNDLIFESDPEKKSKENKQKEKKTKENKSTSIAQKKSTNRKRKIVTESVEDNNVDTTIESLVNEVSGVVTEVKKPKRGRKRKSKKLDEDFEDSDEINVSLNVVSATETGESKVKRNRKSKKLPDDFIDSDEINMLIEEEMLEETVSGDELNFCVETEVMSQSESTLNSCIKDNCETTNIEILCVENVYDEDLNACLNINKSLIVEENASDVTQLIAIENDGTILQKNFKDLNACLNINKSLIVEENASDVTQLIAIENDGTILQKKFKDLNACLNINKSLMAEENASDVTHLIAIENDGTILQKNSQVDENEQEQCITVEYIDINQDTDSPLVNNVMAYEVVSSSSAAIPRRRKMNFTPKVPIKEKKIDQPPKISSTSYTPV